MCLKTCSPKTPTHLHCYNVASANAVKFPPNLPRFHPLISCLTIPYLLGYCRDAGHHPAEIDESGRATPSPPSNALSHTRLDMLRAGWSHPCFLYPDLVCLNLDPEGQAQGLSTYVTVK